MPFLSFGELYGSNLAAYVTGQAYFLPKISRDFFGHFCIWLEKVPLIFYSFSITTKKNTGNHYFRGNENIQQKIRQLLHKYVKRRYARQWPNCFGSTGNPLPTRQDWGLLLPVGRKLVLHWPYGITRAKPK